MSGQSSNSPSRATGPRRVKLVFSESYLKELLGLADDDSIRSVMAYSDPMHVQIVVDSPRAPRSFPDMESPIVHLGARRPPADFADLARVSVWTEDHQLEWIPLAEAALDGLGQWERKLGSVSEADQTVP